MKLKGLITVVFVLFCLNANSTQQVIKRDTVQVNKHEIIDTDSLLNAIFIKKKPKTETKSQNIAPDSERVYENKATKSFDNKDIKSVLDKSISEQTIPPFSLPSDLTPVKIDSLVLFGNPLFIDLVFMGYPDKFKWNNKPNLKAMYFGKNISTLTSGWYTPVKVPSVIDVISDLRKDAREEITRKAANLYIMTYDQLPDPNANKSHIIESEPIDRFKFANNDNRFNSTNKSIYYKKEKLGPWFHKASALAQFSENTVTPNWYQGGINNIATLGILSGQLNYDNKKSVQWENSAEWRLGLNTVPGDTIHMLSTNDDVLKINSKLGFKAGGNFFYTGTVDFSTQFFDSYKGINSNILKTSFLTPIRLNIGVGLDYKYKKIFSLMLSPISYKYIYSNNKLVNPNIFGILTGQNYLSEIGSSFTAQVSYPISHEIQLDSKLSFYTNYQKLSVDWEIVCNMVINRFMSTRICVNPRYDSTVIMPNGDKAELQFKQLVSVGFSHRF